MTDGAPVTIFTPKIYPQPQHVLAFGKTLSEAKIKRYEEMRSPCPSSMFERTIISLLILKDNDVEEIPC